MNVIYLNMICLCHCTHPSDPLGAIVIILAMMLSEVFIKTLHVIKGTVHQRYCSFKEANQSL